LAWTAAQRCPMGAARAKFGAQLVDRGRRKPESPTLAYPCLTIHHCFNWRMRNARCGQTVTLLKFRKVGRRTLLWLLNELENIVAEGRTVREKAVYRILLVCEDFG
jgi:hypothetical protein